MDYWCALWFWPIDKADLLPTRSEFLFDMSLILEGTMGSVTISKDIKRGQLTWMETENEQLAMDILNTYGTENIVDIPRLRKENPRLDLAAQIAEQNKFMHWELEFADLFADRGGFDLVIGNPPWIKLTWEEKGVLSDKQPMFDVRKLTATQTTYNRDDALKNSQTRRAYFEEYESTAGQQSFLGATQNYPDLSGAVNLFKCFLPQAWNYGCEAGVSAFIHPEGVYEDPQGGKLRKKLYARLRKHFQFANELKLFSEVHHATTFSLNVYGSPQIPSFDSISNLYNANCIIECYEGNKLNSIPEMKDELGNWNTSGHPDRIIHVTKKELAVFAKLFDNNNSWESASLPAVHAQILMSILSKFSDQGTTLSTMKDDIYTTGMWNETSAQQDGTIKFSIAFPSYKDVIYSGAHIGIANPYYKTTRSKYRVNSDYDCVDLTNIGETYSIREKYCPSCSLDEYRKRCAKTPWGCKVIDEYRLLNREMVGCTSERTMCVAIGAPGFSYVNTIFGVSYKNMDTMVSMAGYECSLPFDFLVRTIGKSHVNYATTMLLPVVSSPMKLEIQLRALLLNCLSDSYKILWEKMWNNSYANDNWTKKDSRLRVNSFRNLECGWSWNTPLRTDFERRQALIEIDVLTAMALEITLNQLKCMYKLQFSVLQDYEANTYYDSNGRITFTNNKGLVGVGVTRAEFENPGAITPIKRSDECWDGIMKNAPAGYVFARTIIDDTMPGGPVERTIEYVAPFDRCDREQDYETAWKFFEDKYGKED